MSRYEAMFSRCQRRGVLVPFVLLGYPDLERSIALADALIEAGADALEVGIPFSDPIADGPLIAAAAAEALRAGATPTACLDAIAGLRARSPQVPLGLLVYSNLIEPAGIEGFASRAAEVGLDSVLVADVPLEEAAPYVQALRDREVDPVLIAPTELDDAELGQLAAWGAGYTYVLARRGVTGADAAGPDAQRGSEIAALIARLTGAGAPPPLAGFGISGPAHVEAALASGAAGVICGSALLRRYQRDGIEGAVDLAGALLRALDPSEDLDA